jgi:transcriptional antiterminator NusG
MHMENEDVVNEVVDGLSSSEETLNIDSSDNSNRDENLGDAIELDGEDVISEDSGKSSNEVEGAFWYIVQCYALYESKVRDRILQMQEAEAKDVIFRVLLPEEETVEIKNNERKEKIKKMFPGYLFVQMKPDEATWYMIRRLPGVAKLVGAKNEPTPVSDEEINRILRQLGEKMKKIEVDFELSEVIKVISGPFRGYTGAISEINPERGKLKSLISIFGRETPVELDFDQVEKYVGNK